MHTTHPPHDSSSLATHSSLTATPFSSPIPTPIGRTPSASPPLSASPPDCLPFNSFHLAAEYNLYQVKAHLSSSTVPSPPPPAHLPPRHHVKRYPQAAIAVKRRSAPTSAYPSDDEQQQQQQKDDSRAVFTSRAFHSSAATPLSTTVTSSACLHIPRWYYEDQLRQVVEQMERASVHHTAHQHQQTERTATAPTPHPSPAAPVCRTVSRTSTRIHQRPLAPLGPQQAEGRADKKVKLEQMPTPKLRGASIEVETNRRQQAVAVAAASTGLPLTTDNDTEWEDDMTGDDEAASVNVSAKECDESVLSLGMDLRRLKLLEMATGASRSGRGSHSARRLTHRVCLAEQAVERC